MGSFQGFKRGQARRRTAGSFSRSKKRRTFRMRRSEALLGVEKKFYDTSLSGATVNSPTDASSGELDPSATSMISTPAQGDGEQNRDGKKIIGKSVQVSGTLNLASVADATAFTLYPAEVKVFLALVLDTQTNGAQLNSEDVFKNTAGSAASCVTPQRNMLFASRFKVLKSEVLTLPARLVSYDGTNIELSGCQEAFNWFVKLNNLPINFNSGTTASVANVVDNSIHLIGYSQNSLVTITYNARLRFVG